MARPVAGAPAPQHQHLRLHHQVRGSARDLASEWEATTATPWTCSNDDDIDLPAEPTAIAVVIVSDGAWEPLVRDIYAGKAKQSDPVGKVIAAKIMTAASPHDSARARLGPGREAGHAAR